MNSPSVTENAHHFHLCTEETGHTQFEFNNDKFRLDTVLFEQKFGHNTILDALLARHSLVIYRRSDAQKQIHDTNLYRRTPQIL